MGDNILWKFAQAHPSNPHPLFIGRTSCPNHLQSLDFPTLCSCMRPQSSARITRMRPEPSRRLGLPGRFQSAPCSSSAAAPQGRAQSSQRGVTGATPRRRPRAVRRQAMIILLDVVNAVGCCCLACVLACRILSESPTDVPDGCQDGSMGDNILWKFAQAHPSNPHPIFIGRSSCPNHLQSLDFPTLCGCIASCCVLKAARELPACVPSRARAHRSSEFPRRKSAESAACESQASGPVWPVSISAMFKFSSSSPGPSPVQPARRDRRDAAPPAARGPPAGDDHPAGRDQRRGLLQPRQHALRHVRRHQAGVRVENATTPPRLLAAPPDETAAGSGSGGWQPRPPGCRPWGPTRGTLRLSRTGAARVWTGVPGPHSRPS
jgi:hypothetical protein